MESSVSVSLTRPAVSDEVSCSTNKEESQGKTLYTVEDRPPFFFSFLNALQILVCQILFTLWLPLMMTPAFCVLPADPLRVYLVSTAFLTSGVITTIQTTLGIRLPTVAAPSLLYAAGFLSLLRRPALQCPSNGDLFAMGPELRTAEWQTRLREVQGALVFAGIFQALLGFSGLQALMCKVLSPVVVIPGLILSGLSAIQEPLPPLTDWRLFLIVNGLVILFSLRLRNVSLPLPKLSIHNGLTAKSFPVFRMFPVLWTCVAVFLVYKAVSFFNNGTSQPDIQLVEFRESIDNSKWFFFPFPFEWGLPTLSVATAVHIFPFVLLQSATSYLLYYGCASSCGVGPPPGSAVSRGLGVEGLGLLFGALWGHPVTSSSGNIALMSLSGIVSRSSTQLAALLLICISHFTRVTSMLANIPIQFLSSLHLCLQAGLVCVGISMLRLIRFTSPHDGTVMGFSLFLGLVVPQNAPSIDMGLEVLNSFFSHMLSSSVFVAIVSGCLLDLLIPGRANNNQSRIWKYRPEEDNRIYRLLTWEEFICNALENSPFFSTN